MSAPSSPGARKGRMRWINLASFAVLLLLWFLITAPLVHGKPLPRLRTT